MPTMFGSRFKRNAAPAKKLPRPVALIIWSAFFLFGSFFPTIMVIIPLWRSIAAHWWQSVPCVITTSQVQKSGGGKGGPVFAIDIQYRYQFSGTKFVSNRYDFTTGASSGEGAKQLIVARYPVGL